MYSFTHWLRPRHSPLPPHLGSYTRVLLVSQARRHLFCNPLPSTFLCGDKSSHWPPLTLSPHMSTVATTIISILLCCWAPLMVSLREDCALRTIIPFIYINLMVPFYYTGHCTSFGILSIRHILYVYTDKKEKKIFLIHTEIQRHRPINGFLIYDEIYAHFLIY